MTMFRVVALATETVQKVLATGKSPGYGHPAHVEVAAGHGPCRHCLRPFRAGQERRVLFTCNPFHNLAEVPLPGPVFVHEQLCGRYAERGGYPPDLLPFPVVFDGYDSEQNLVSQRRSGESDHEQVLEKMLENDAVAYILVRDRKAGCFDFRVERGCGAS